MTRMRVVTNEPVRGFVIDPNNPIRDGLALMIDNCYAYPNKDGTAPLQGADGEIIVAGKQHYQWLKEYYEELIQPFLSHLRRIMPNDPRDVDIFLNYMAFKQQYTALKPRWAIVLAGEQGIGKDISIEACWEEYGLGYINSISPVDIMSPYNDYIQCLLLRISEAADLAESNRWTFNERLKVLIAGHPDHILVNKKYGFKYWCDLYCGVIMTTNHLDSGLYIPIGDRRTYVIKCASAVDCGLETPAEKREYFTNLFKWFTTKHDDGFNLQGATGYELIGRYLYWARNVEEFREKYVNVCPEPTAAKVLVMNESDGTPDWLDDLLADYLMLLQQKLPEILQGADDPAVIEAIQTVCAAGAGGDYPMVVSVRVLKKISIDGGMGDRVNRQVKYVLARAGYDRLINPNAADGKWRVLANGKQIKETLYVHTKVKEKAKSYATAMLLAIKPYAAVILQGAAGVGF